VEARWKSVFMWEEVPVLKYVVVVPDILKKKLVLLRYEQSFIAELCDG
jgi:hypothetical protein